MMGELLLKVKISTPKVKINVLGIFPQMTFKMSRYLLLRPILCLILEKVDRSSIPKLKWASRSALLLLPSIRLSTDPKVNPSLIK